eukprot:5705560-Amphidinium_carterae.1
MSLWLMCTSDCPPVMPYAIAHSIGSLGIPKPWGCLRPICGLPVETETLPVTSSLVEDVVVQVVKVQQGKN